MTLNTSPDHCCNNVPIETFTKERPKLLQDAPFLLLLGMVVLEFLLYPRVKVLGAYVRLVDICALFAVIACAWSFIRNKIMMRDFITDNRALLLLILMVLSGGLLSALFSSDRMMSLKKLVQLTERMSLIIFAVWAARGRPVRVILYTIAGMAVLESCVGFTQYLLNYGDVFMWHAVRISGSLGNLLASYLLLGLIITFTFSLKRSSGQWLWFALSGIIFTALVLTQVRSVWILGLFSFMLICLFCMSSLKSLFKVLLALVLSIALLLTVAGMIRPDAAKEYISVLKRRSSNTVVIRVELWHAAVKMFVDHPVTGIGLGNYSSYYHKLRYRSDKIDAIDGSFNLHNEFDAHSDFLTRLAEMGAIGSFLFLIFNIYLLRWAWSARSRLQESGESIAVPIIIIVSLLADFISSPLGGNLFWLLVGLLWLIARKLPMPDPQPKEIA